ncbi:cysteine hydrolase family protein [Pseudodonghicola flavimaris]|uniref:Isochorismatase family cysteine hydrolase n=1 Tax=Pseudodonghicola flavimaris TaxID=3050036 RepID=A0ABT7F6B5_9RHOB|nr:isochorismatase family cysteine hydrolase [Pseudodonghicola flavimaris]MDK3020139.1 isochorismatase family cysteine hydrolase [Pseudodonghicola flavimaris]
MKALVYGAEKEIPDDVFSEWVSRPDTAVISIDMHEGHLSTDPMCPCPAPRGREIIEPVNEFHRAARAMGVPVIHVRSVLRATGEDDLKGAHPAAWRTLFPLTVGEIPGIDQHAIEGTQWNEFSTEVLEADLIVETKRRLSPFYPTDLDFLLRSMGVKRVVLNGGMTDCCVLNATFDASNIGYRVCVAADLVRGTNEEMEQAALKIISLHTGVVMASEEILRVWESATA